MGGNFAPEYAINLSILRNLLVPLPDIGEQKSILEFLINIDRKLDVEQFQYESLDLLFKTLLNNLMTGKIRVNDLEHDA